MPVAIEAAQAWADEQAAKLLRLLQARADLPLAAAAKALDLRQSELRRLLSLLGDTPALGGLGLVELVAADGRSPRLRLSARGRDWLAAQP